MKGKFQGLQELSSVKRKLVSWGGFLDLRFLREERYGGSSSGDVLVDDYTDFCLCIF
jgi:hypothetical protein